MSISARDENGKEVDWWFIYKVPLLAKTTGTASATGYEYLYFDPNQQAPSQSKYTLDSDSGALHQTLDAVGFDQPGGGIGWVLYNDEKPASAGGSDNSELGHTKGVIVFDTASGTAFWLLHSWPKYVDPKAKPAAMPTPIYGQTFLCLSLSLDTANQIALQMDKDQEPQVYLPRTGGLPANSGLAQLTAKINPDQTADHSVVSYKTQGNMAFKVIAKNRMWGKDFWNDLVGPTLGEDMDDETWIRGPIPPVLDSDGVHKTFDIKFIDLRPIGAPWSWPETHDHAKWGITTAGNWVCVGDINRMISQESRGGGTIAFQNAALWTALSKTDLLVAPPGKTQAQALDLIQSTHGSTPAGPKRS